MSSCAHGASRARGDQAAEPAWNPVPVPLSTTNTEHVLPPNPSGLFVHGRAGRASRDVRVRPEKPRGPVGSGPRRPQAPPRLPSSGESRAHQLSRHRHQGSRWAVPGTGRRAPVCAPTCAGAAQVGGHRPAPAPHPSRAWARMQTCACTRSPRAGVRRGQLLGRRTWRGPGRGAGGPPRGRRGSPAEPKRSLSSAPLPGPSRCPPPAARPLVPPSWEGPSCAAQPCDWQ